jgi:cell wall-associated NlpC family hydrolase
MMGALLITAVLPLFSVGTSSDIALQVPAGLNAMATDYAEIDMDIELLSARSDDSEEVVVETTAQPSIYSPDSNVGKSVISNTFQIVEQNAQDGTPVELLALSEFVLDNSTVYICVSEANVRSTPSASGELVATVAYSDRVTRVGIGSSWTRIQMEDLSEGYLLSEFVTTSFIATPTPTPKPTPTPTPKPVITETAASGTYYAKGELNVRSGPGTGYSLLKTLNTGDPVEVVAQTSNGWFKTVVGSYVLANLVTSTQPGTSAPVSGNDGGTVDAPAITPADPASTDLATYAKSLIGVPYVYTGMSTSGFDCSGYVSYVYAHYYNYSLPHKSSTIAGLGTPIAEGDITIGDVICYDYSGDGVVDHVGIYIGDGQLVHASSRLKKVVLANFSMSSVTTIRRFI